MPWKMIIILILWCQVLIFFFFFVSVSRTKIQWKSIRDAYVKYQKKRLQHPRIRPYIYEKDLEFMLPQVLEAISKLKTVENQSISPNTSELQEDDTISISSCSDLDSGEMEEEPMDQKQEPFEEVSFEYITKSNSVYQNQPELTRTVHKTESVEAHNEMFYNIEHDKKEHPVDAFFYGIAQTVKQLKPSTISRIKKTVTNIVLDAEAEEVNQVEVSFIVKNR